MNFTENLHLLFFLLIIFSAILSFLMLLYISTNYLKVMDKIVFGREFNPDNIFHKIIRINGYIGMIVLKRNREKESIEVQRKIMALDNKFKKPFIIMHWAYIIFGILFLIIYLVDNYFLTPNL